MSAVSVANMGQKKVITKSGSADEGQPKEVSVKKSTKKQLVVGVMNVASSYNNTLVNVTDARGNVVVWSSAGLLGFKGARKSTPYAATLVAKDASEKGKKLGLQDVTVVIRGIGPGREAAIRGIASSGLNINSIVDDTPMAHNGVRAKKPRRV